MRDLIYIYDKYFNNYYYKLNVYMIMILIESMNEYNDIKGLCLGSKIKSYYYYISELTYRDNLYF